MGFVFVCFGKFRKINDGRMSSDDGVSERGMASRVGLSVTSRTNLSGIVFGLIFLSS